MNLVFVIAQNITNGAISVQTGPEAALILIAFISKMAIMVGTAFAIYNTLSFTWNLALAFYKGHKDRKRLEEYDEYIEINGIDMFPPKKDSDENITN